MIVKVGEAVYDLATFEHPGGKLAMFGVTNSPDPMGLLFQYHEFSAKRLSEILAPHCISERPASLEELEAVRRPYTRSTELRTQIKKALGPQIKRLRQLETRFTNVMHMLGWPAFIAFALATAHFGVLGRALAVVLYAAFVHVVLVWNLHGQSHIVSLGADDHVTYCWRGIPFAPHSLAWMMQHTVLHHSFTGVAYNAHDPKAKEHISFDPDVRFSGVMRLSPDEEWLPNHRYQYIYAPLALGLTVWALMIDMALLSTKKQLQLYQQLSVAVTSAEERWLSLLLPASVLSVVGAVYLLGMHFGCFMLTPTLCSFSVGYVNIPTHTNLKTSFPAESDDYFAAQLAESTSYGGVVSNLLTAGLSKQIEHHLYPNAPFSALPAMTTYVQAYAKEQGVEYRSFSSFWTCLASWYLQVCRLALPPEELALKEAKEAKESGNSGKQSPTGATGSPLLGPEETPTVAAALAINPLKLGAKLDKLGAKLD